MSAKILLWDIETAPTVSFHWRHWKENIPQDFVIQQSHMLTWAAKFLGEDEVYYDATWFHSDDVTDDSGMLANLIELLDEADIAIAHNGDKFDMKWVRKQIALHRLHPPRRPKQIDTLKVAKGLFNFPSNRLDDLAKYLQCDNVKIKTDMSLWKDTVAGDPVARQNMIDYNIQDLEPLEEVYLALRNQMRNHPNLGNYTDNEQSECPSCGSTRLYKNGFYRTNISRFQRYGCRDCGDENIRGRKNLNTKEKQDVLVVKGI